MRYGEGPTKRVSPPRTAPAPKPVAVTPSVPGPRPTSGAKTGAGKTASPNKGPDLAPAREVKSWREVRRSDPEAAREIFVATNLAGRAHDVAVGVAVGSIGGVYAGGFRGGHTYNDPWVSDPWGWSGWNSCSSYWSFGSWAWCGWSYAFYWSCYYPCWWWYTRPYYYADYCYYPVTSVVYSSPQVIYVEGSSEPVGEAYVADAAPSVEPANRPAPAVPELSPLSIAAQRYLELGDRAFREGRYTDAVQLYAKAVEFAPDQGALYLVLADALFAAGDYHYGAYTVRRAIELDPALIESNVDKHGFYPDPSQFDEQLATLERYLEQHPSDRDARLVLALNYLFGGRAKDAARVIESSFSDMAQDSAAVKILARALAIRD